jgi:hypothetical protein
MIKDKLIKLINFCKRSVCVEINDHKSFHEKIKNYMEERFYEHLDQIGKDVLEKIYELDNLVSIQFYLNTSIGFYRVFHYDLDKALDLALKIADGIKSKGEA